MPRRLVQVKRKQVQGYIRVSPLGDDDNENHYEKVKMDYREQIMDFAKTKGWESKLSIVEEYEDRRLLRRKRKLTEIVYNLEKGDVLVLPKLSMVDSHMFGIYRFLQTLNEKGVDIYLINDGVRVLANEINNFDFLDSFKLFLDTANSVSRTRILEHKLLLKEKEEKSGRPPGAGKSQLDEHLDEIIKLLKQGSTQKYIARKFKVSPATVSVYMKKHGLDQIEMDFDI